MEVKVKLQKPKQETRRKTKLKRKNAGNSDDKLYEHHFFSQLGNGEIIKDKAGGPPPPLPLFYLNNLKQNI